MSKEQEKQPPGQNKTYKIYVSGREENYTGHKITYREVVKLFDPAVVFDGDFEYTVNYTRGHKDDPKGSLSDNDSVTVQDEMDFYVKKTFKS